MNKLNYESLQAELRELNLEALPTKVQVARMKEIEKELADVAENVYNIAKEIFELTPRLLGEFEDHIKLDELKEFESIEEMFEYISMSDEDYAVTGDFENSDTWRRIEKFDEFVNDVKIKIEETFDVCL